MSEVTVTIFDRPYRLAVSSGEEELLKSCARDVDAQMQAVRSAGRVIGNEQIAVLTALELAYDAKKRSHEADHEAEARAAAPAGAAEAAHAAPAAEVLRRSAEQEAEKKEMLAEIKALCQLCEEALYRDAKMGTLF